jgi:hypothetical protein
MVSIIVSIFFLGEKNPTIFSVIKIGLCRRLCLSSSTNQTSLIEIEELAVVSQGVHVRLARSILRLGRNWPKSVLPIRAPFASHKYYCVSRERHWRVDSNSKRHRMEDVHWLPKIEPSNNERPFFLSNSKAIKHLKTLLISSIPRFLKCSGKSSKYKNIVRNFLIYIFVKYGRNYLILLFLSWLYIITKLSFLYTLSVPPKMYVHYLFFRSSSFLIHWSQVLSALSMTNYYISNFNLMYLSKILKH